MRARPDTARHLYVTLEIAEILDHPNALRRFSRVETNIKITNFLLGRQMAVSRENRKWKKKGEPDLVKLAGHDEIWELCFREPKPGWRLFGRFLEAGVFVGLELHAREEVDHGKVASSIIATWNEKFPGIDPVSSNDLADYVSGVWRDVDGEDG